MRLLFFTPPFFTLQIHRDGVALSTTGRRFFNMKDPKVQEYLSERVIRLLKECGFGYMKMDYNDTIGLGCDGAESLGEGLRQDREASVGFVRKVKEEVPGIVLENHRLIITPAEEMEAIAVYLSEPTDS